MYDQLSGSKCIDQHLPSCGGLGFSLSWLSSLSLDKDASNESTPSSFACLLSESGSGFVDLDVEVSVDSGWDMRLRSESSEQSAFDLSTDETGSDEDVDVADRGCEASFVVVAGASFSPRLAWLSPPFPGALLCLFMAKKKRVRLRDRFYVCNPRNRVSMQPKSHHRLCCICI